MSVILTGVTEHHFYVPQSGPVCPLICMNITAAAAAAAIPGAQRAYSSYFMEEQAFKTALLASKT